MSTYIPYTKIVHTIFSGLFGPAPPTGDEVETGGDTLRLGTWTLRKGLVGSALEAEGYSSSLAIQPLQRSNAQLPITKLS